MSKLPLLSGRARVTRGEDTLYLEENQSTFIPVGTKHQRRPRRCAWRAQVIQIEYLTCNLHNRVWPSRHDSAAAQLGRHPLRGALLENLVVLEALKGFYHRGLAPRMHFYRDSNGNEVDLLLEHGAGLYAVEIKAGATIASDYFRGLARFAALMAGRLAAGAVVYGGDSAQQRSGMQVAPALSCDLLFSRWLGKRRRGR